MLRHAIPPARFFSQVPNEILRHPRLSSDAVRLLTWQLSLPQDTRESLSRTAERAGIKKTAFQHAKRSLKAEGYLHEWREQAERGRWVTHQMVSNTPLSAEDAGAVRRRGAGVVHPAPVRLSAPVRPAPHGRERSAGLPRPTGGSPAAGRPTRRSVGRHPEHPLRENTSHLPPAPVAEAETGPGPVSGPPPGPPAHPEARRTVEALHLLDPRLRVPRGMLPQLAALATDWLRRGHSPEAVHSAIRQSLPSPPTAVHHPGGLVRHILRDAPPPRPAPAPKPVPPVSLMRECEGDHMQPLLFRPVADESHCADCREPLPATP